MYHTAHTFGPFGYATNSLSFPTQKETDRQKSLANIAREISRSKDQFSDHFRKRYGNDHKHLPKDSIALPAWMLCEVISFGSMQNFYRNSITKIKRDVANFAHMPPKVFDSWLHALTVIRNVCAHHGRLWNKELGIKPLIPRPEYTDWHSPVQVTNERVFGILTICSHLINQYDSSNDFPNRFCNLITEHPNIPLISMGFPKNWRDSPIWNLPKNQDTDPATNDQPAETDDATQDN